VIPNPEQLAGPLQRVIARAHEADAEVLAVQLPRLDRPFADTAAKPDVGRHMVLEAAARAGAHTMVLARHLQDHDVEAVRLDTCCHYNDVGHQALAQVFTGWLTSWAADP
jgi:hypothetical protein